MAAVQSGNERGEQLDFTQRPFLSLPQALLITACEVFAAKITTVRQRQDWAWDLPEKRAKESKGQPLP